MSPVVGIKIKSICCVNQLVSELLATLPHQSESARENPRADLPQSVSPTFEWLTSFY